MNLFSWPVFFPNGSYTLAGYNLVVSRQSAQGAPKPMGPYTTLASNVVGNTDFYDASGKVNDLYRITPIINIIGGPSAVVYDTAQSRPFFASQPLYDIQISALLDAFRQGYIKDAGIPLTDSTLPTESTGTNAMPFMTDSQTTRFYTSFLQNDDPVKLMASNCLVYLGTNRAAATPLTQYTDFYVNEIGGYIDFAVVPPTSYYMRVEYTKVLYTNDELRNILLNSVSDLSLYGINNFEVRQSNNLYYLVNPLPNRDLGSLIMEIAYRKYIDQEMLRGIEAAESWEDGKVKWAADPGRALQAASGALSDLRPEIRIQARNYILNNRSYRSRGEFESFFDVSGVLPLYSLLVSGPNLAGQMGWWL